MPAPDPEDALSYTGGWPPPADDVAAMLERALGVPPGSGRVVDAAPRAVWSGPVTGPASAPRTRMRSAGPPRRSRERSAGRRRPRRGLAAGLVLVAALGAAHLLVRSVGGRAASARASSDGALSAVTSASAPAATAEIDASTALLARVPAAWRASCRAASGLDTTAATTVTCSVQSDGFAAVELRAFADVGELRRSYGLQVGHQLGSPLTGVARCARGRQEERGWTTPENPTRRAGRYACRVERGTAQIWWTVERARLLVHATRADGDLAALFAWWRSGSPDGLG